MILDKKKILFQNYHLKSETSVKNDEFKEFYLGRDHKKGCLLSSIL
jgi:hypothetical protein